MKAALSSTVRNSERLSLGAGDDAWTAFISSRSESQGRFIEWIDHAHECGPHVKATEKCEHCENQPHALSGYRLFIEAIFFGRTGLSFRLTHCYSSNLGYSRTSCSTALLESSRSHILGNALLLPCLAFHDLCLCLCSFALLTHTAAPKCQPLGWPCYSSAAGAQRRVCRIFDRPIGDSLRKRCGHDRLSDRFCLDDPRNNAPLSERRFRR